MFRESDVASIRGRFPGKVMSLLIESAIAGNTVVKAWHSPKGAVLWDEANLVLYVNLESMDEESKGFLGSVVRSAMLCVLDRFKWYGISLRCLGGAQLDEVVKSLAAVKSKTGLSRHYIHDGGTLPVARGLSQGFEVVSVTREFLGRENLGNIEELRFEISKMWPNTARYFERGFAYVAHDGREAASWCTGEFVSEKMCGVGAWTAEAHRRMGLALACGAAFVRRALSEGKTIYWECSAENEASNNLAKRLGFTLAEEHPVYHIMLK